MTRRQHLRSSTPGPLARSRNTTDQKQHVKSLTKCPSSTMAKRSPSHLTCCTGARNDAPKKSFAYFIHPWPDKKLLRRFRTTLPSTLALMLMDLKDHTQRATSQYHLAPSHRKTAVPRSSTYYFAGARKSTNKPSRDNKSRSTYSIMYVNGPKNSVSASISMVEFSTSGMAAIWLQTQQPSPTGSLMRGCRF